MADFRYQRTWFAVLSIALVTAMTQPAATQIRNSPPELIGDCGKYFSQWGLYSYSYISRVNGRAVFAIADGADGQWCGFSTNYDLYDPDLGIKDDGGLFLSLANIEDLKRVAIARCNSVKPAGSRTRCSVYAVAKNIIWQDPGEDLPSLPPDILAPPPTPQSKAIHNVDDASIEDAKNKCADLGFTRGTPKFGDCVLKLTR